MSGPSRAADAVSDLVLRRELAGGDGLEEEGVRGQGAFVPAVDSTWIND